VGANVTNDHVESNFGVYDMLARMFRGTTVENISGMAQQARSHDFDRPLNVAHDRRKRKEGASEEAPPAGGFFWTGLNDRLRESLVEMGRRTAAAARVDGRVALVLHDAHKLAHREERVIKMLNAAVDHYAHAMELFNAWSGPQRATGDDDIEAGLFEADEGGTRVHRKSEAEQLEFLRKQIEMRMLGLGWTQFSTRWSSHADQKIGSVKHLTALLKEIIAEEVALARLKKLPVEAAPPHHEVMHASCLACLHSLILSYAVLSCTVLYCPLLYYTILYYTILPGARPGATGHCRCRRS
jgi:hypothetical protein